MQPFALLLVPASLRFTPSLCRCPFLLLGFQPLAVSFCLSSCLCPGFFLFVYFCPAACPCLSALYPLTLPLSDSFPWFSALCCFILSLSCRFCPFLPLSFLFPCCFALSLCALPSYSAAVCAFSLVSSSLPFSFVSFLSFLPFFASFSSFFRPFCFHKPLTNSTFARTPSESPATTSQPSHCCRYVTTS